MSGGRVPRLLRVPLPGASLSSLGTSLNTAASASAASSMGGMDRYGSSMSGKPGWISQSDLISKLSPDVSAPWAQAAMAVELMQQGGVGVPPQSFASAMLYDDTHNSMELESCSTLRSSRATSSSRVTGSSSIAAGAHGSTSPIAQAISMASVGSHRRASDLHTILERSHSEQSCSTEHATPAGVIMQPMQPMSASAPFKNTRAVRASDTGLAAASGTSSAVRACCTIAKFLQDDPSMTETQYAQFIVGRSAQGAQASTNAASPKPTRSQLMERTSPLQLAWQALCRNANSSSREHNSAGPSCSRSAGRRMSMPQLADLAAQSGVAINLPRASSIPGRHHTYMLGDDPAEFLQPGPSTPPTPPTPPRAG